jgi:OOP family OmpA-OmpF porin
MTASRSIAATGILLLTAYCGSAAADNDFYVFGTIGNTDSTVFLGGQNRIGDDSTRWALGAGYGFSGNFSVQASYVDFGSHYAETDCPPGFSCLVIPVPTEADMTGIALSLTGKLPLARNLDAYGKIGLLSWDVEFDDISAAFDTSGEDLLYGAGLRWSVANHWDLFAEYERVDLDLDTASIGVSYRF